MNFYLANSFDIFYPSVDFKNNIKLMSLNILYIYILVKLILGLEKILNNFQNIKILFSFQKDLKKKIFFILDFTITETSFYYH